MTVERTLTQPIAGVLTARDRASRSSGAVEARAGIGIREEEFEQLVREHQQRIFRVLMGLVRDADAADTLTQECFLRAYQKRATFRGEASVGTWLVRIAVNLAMDHGRSRRRAFWSRVMGGGTRNAEGDAVAMLEVAHPDASPERALAARQELAAVWDAADALAPQQRTVFLLRFAEEMTLEEIANATDLEVGTVKAHLFRAVGAVRKRVGHRGTEARRKER